MWKLLRSVLGFSSFWISITVIANLMEERNNELLTYWNVNSGVMLLFVMICLITSRIELKLWQKLAWWLSIFPIHVLFTIPAAATLGILMYDDNHIRTLGEHRAVFFIAAVPIIYIAMWNSRIFYSKIHFSIKSEDC